jgi:hypothetical protein
MDCTVPADRRKKLPIARLSSEKPTILTERLLRYQMSRRFSEIRDLECEGPIPQHPEKVQELHQFAIDFQKNLPDFYQTSNPETKWDIEYPFVPVHRTLLAGLINSFCMTLHRPYIFTRESSQQQVFYQSIELLENLEQLCQQFQDAQIHFFTSLAFPTFDAAILLAMVLVANPERYHKSFSRAYHNLKNVLDNLEFISPTVPLAKSAAEILRFSVDRVMEAHNLVDVHGQFPWHTVLDPGFEGSVHTDTGHITSTIASMKPDEEQWHFEIDPSAMDWTSQSPTLANLDFSNIQVPKPLKELLHDDRISPSESAQGQEGEDNAFWNFLAGYPT